MLPPQAQAPVPVVSADESKLPGVQPQPVPSLPTVAVKPPKRPRKKTTASVKPAEPVPPVQVAVAEPAPSVAVIGTLTAGDDASPAKRQAAADLLLSIEKRLKALPTKLSDEQKRLAVGAKNFLLQAQQAFKGGDIDGATTLGTKAKLLLDDLAK